MQENKDRLNAPDPKTGKPRKVSKEEVRMYLLDGKRQEAQHKILDDVLADAKVETVLDLPRIQISDRDAPFKGGKNAKVVVNEFSDFQCPYCKDFAEGAERRIIEELVKTGRINLTYKYFPVIDSGKIGESHWAAQAAECASAG